MTPISFVFQRVFWFFSLFSIGYNSYGQEILNIVNDLFTIAGKYYINVNLPDLQKGVYYLRIKTKDNKIIKKIIKL